MGEYCGLCGAQNTAGGVLFSSSIRRMPQGIPTPACGSEENDAGLNHRRVMAGLISVDRRIARPSEDKSPAEVYMFPVLRFVLTSIQLSTRGCDIRRFFPQIKPPQRRPLRSRNDPQGVLWCLDKGVCQIQGCQHRIRY